MFFVGNGGVLYVLCWEWWGALCSLLGMVGCSMFFVGNGGVLYVLCWEWWGALFIDVHLISTFIN